MTIHFSTLTNTDMSNNGRAALVNTLMAEAGYSAAVTPVDQSNDFPVSGTITFNGMVYTLPNNATQWTWYQTATVAWDENAGVLVITSGTTPRSTVATDNISYASSYVYVLIAGGHLWWGSGPHNTTIAEAFNVGTGMTRAAADTTRAMLTPLIADGIDMTPVFISQNFVIDTAGTTVTDTAGNKFVSLGNLLYVKDAVASEPAGTAVTCRVGSVSTLPAGSQATVTNSGTLNDLVLDFGIPAGADGTGSSSTLPPATASTLGGVKIGSGISVTDDGTISATGGDSNHAGSGNNSVAVGNGAKARDGDTVAVGYQAESIGDESLSVGGFSNASGSASFAIGTRTVASATCAAAIGTHAVATANYAIALGPYSVAEDPYTVSFGKEDESGGTFTRRLVLVTDPVNPQDAATKNYVDAHAASGGYTLPAATTSTLGGVKVGSGLTVASDGTLSASGQATDYTPTETSTIIGRNASATGDNTNVTLVGHDSTATGKNSTTLGATTNAAEESIAIGSGATAPVAQSTVIGRSATVTGNGTQGTALGWNAASSGWSTAIGARSKASGVASTVIGDNAQAGGEHATTIGAGANASGAYSVAIGALSQATDDNTVSVGSNTLKRRIVNVADPTGAQDAATKHYVDSHAASGSYTLPPATAFTLGGVKIGSGITVATDGTISASGMVTPAAAIADLTAAPTAGDFNALLNALRAAGLMDRPTTTPKVPVKSISISPSSPTVKEHETLHLSAAVTPDNATDKTVSWSSGDKQTATVTSDGTVTGIKQGSTSITATANDGSKVSSSDTLTVTSTPAQTEPVDVYIGDSTTAIWDTAPEDKNWTTLISNADGVGRVNVAVVGSGFTNDASKNAAFPAQVTTAVGKTQGKTVRRVFLVGLWNDLNSIQSDPSGEMNAMTKTADAIKSAWPGSQLLYIPEVAPQTDYSTSMVAKYSSTINQVYALFEGKGFNVAHDWLDWMPDGKTNGYMHDTIHPNAKAMNVAAHKIREWVNTLSGPRITGEIPAWGE